MMQSVQEEKQHQAREEVGLYEVERFVETRFRKGHQVYHVRCKEFKAKDDDWKLRGDITDELYSEYIATHTSQAEDSDEEDDSEAVVVLAGLYGRTQVKV